ncbi:MAG: FtsX-like permease family protein [Ruminococcus callidus]|nr:FtsX-like permease family protein [Ruminococcus callidus]
MQSKINNQSVEEMEQIQYTDYIGLMMSSITTIINTITYVLIAFVAISLIVFSIMIGVITLISVQKRTKEIGILRAIGASKREICSMFNAETIIIGLISGILGVAVTYILCVPINAIIHSLTGINNLHAFLPIPAAVILILILSSIAKSTILQYRQCIAGGGFATKSCRSYCPRKADGFAAAFSGTANNTIVCNREQYISVALTLLSGLIPSRSAAKKDPVVALRTE